MARKYAVQYIDRLLDGETYHDLLELSSAILSSPLLTPDAPDRGLPRFAFLFTETLVWFAQAMRSGVRTYYEATPATRQAAMAVGLRIAAPDGFAGWYERGMLDAKDQQKIRAVDRWMEASDDDAHAWLRQLARDHREALFAIT